MKQTLLTIAVLLIIPTIVAAQAPTRNRKSDDAKSTVAAEASAVRDRVVGTKAANHASDQKTRQPREAELSSQDQIPESSDSTWGNTAVIIRPTETPRIAPTEAQPSPVKRVVTGNQEARGPKKLVQRTALLADTSRAPSASRPVVSTRTVAATNTYNVGIGDVLDVRLANLPTRESTLFTVLKNGTLEYPLLNGPVSVAGMTTDDIANLLSGEIKVIRSAHVTVTVRDYASHSVMVTGIVDSPGRKVLRREAMPLYAVLALALVRPEATAVTIVRNGKDGEALPLNNEQAMATLVQPGDLIRISAAETTAKQFLYIGGAVASPGEKSFREGMTLTQALLSAGGASLKENVTVKIGRRNANGLLSTNEYNLRLIQAGKSPDPAVQPGDRIEVSGSL